MPAAAPERVDLCFPLSVRLATIDTGHDKSAPGGARTPNPGASPIEIGHDRLMETVPLRAHTAPPATCPTCAAPGDGYTQINGLIQTANYLCTAGHIWQTRWTVAA